MELSYLCKEMLLSVNSCGKTRSCWWLLILVKRNQEIFTAALTFMSPGLEYGDGESRLGQLSQPDTCMATAEWRTVNIQQSSMVDEQSLQ